MNLNWYFNRLRAMSIPELAFRVEQLANKKINKYRFQRYFPEVQLKETPKSILNIPDVSFGPKDTHFPILGLDWDYSEPINWHEDIKTNGIFPKVFCRDVNTRSDENGIAKYVWEPNRHQFLTKLAMQYRTTGDAYYLHLFQSALESWIDQNPYLIGVNWYSNIEVNVRLITWFLCWEILDVSKLMEEDSEFQVFVNEKWVPLIYLHCKYSRGFPSKFSSANNHRISEGVGLFIASSFWKFDDSPKWNEYAKKVVEQEFLKQHSKNGINKEETSEYIQFITDFFLIAHVVAENTDNPFSSKFKDRFYLVFDYIYHMLDIEGNINHYGDGDDGRTFILEEDPHDFNNYRSMLTSAAVIFSDGRFKARSNGYDLKNQILFGDKGEEVYESVESTDILRTSKLYKEEGHFLFRKEEHGGKEICMHFDVAPIGYLGIAAHGHADALTFSLGVDGEFFIIDTGTYTYHTDMEWRNYFISTLAHNTICIDNKNQAFRGGPTMWVEHYQPKVHSIVTSDSEEKVVGSHDGYKAHGVMHTREVVFDKVRDRFIIKDIVEVLDNKEHQVQIPFHLHPMVEINQEDDQTFRLSVGDARDVTLKVDSMLKPTIVSGETSPILGWYSPSFYQKSACSVVYSTLTVSSSFELITEIVIHEHSH